MRTIWKVLFLALLLALCAVCAAEGGVVVIPDSTAVIEAEAFLNADMTEVVLPEGIRTIGSRAFAGCSDLERINLPGTLRSIAPDAFDGCDDLVASIPIGGRIQDWCINAGIAYECDPADVVIVQVGKVDIDSNEGVLTAYVQTSRAVDMLSLYDENGDLVACWDRGSSGIKHEARGWYIETPLSDGNTGVIDARWTFVASAGLTVSAPVPIDVYYDPDAVLLVNSFSLNMWQDHFYTEEEIVFWIETCDDSAIYLRITDQNGDIVYSDEVEPEDYEYCDSVSFDEPGEYTLTMWGSENGSDWYPCSEKITLTVVEGSACELYFSAPEFVRPGEPFEFYHDFYGGEIESLGLFADGRLTSWDYEDQIGTSTWTFTTEGQHTLTLKYSLGDGWVEPGVTCIVTATSLPFVSDSCGGMAYCRTGGSMIELRELQTTDDAAYLALFDSDGTIVGRLEASDAAEPGWSGDCLVWSGIIQVMIDDPGMYDYSLAASADGVHYGPHTSYLLQVEARRNEDAVFDVYPMEADGCELTFSVCTSLDATDVRATDPNGNAYIFEIQGEPVSVDYEDEMLEWSVRCTFPAIGHYPVLFQATVDGENWGEPRLIAANVGTDDGHEGPIEFCYFEEAFDTTVAGWLSFCVDEMGGGYAEPDIAEVRMYDADGDVLRTWAADEITFDLEPDQYYANSNVLSYDFGAPGIYFYSVEAEMADGTSVRAYYCVKATEGTGDLTAYRYLSGVQALFGELQWVEIPFTYTEYDEMTGTRSVLTHALTPRETPGRFYAFANTEPVDFALWGESDLSVCGVRLGMTREEAAAAALANGGDPIDAEMGDDRLEFIMRGRYARWYYDVCFEDGVVSLIETFSDPEEK